MKNNVNLCSSFVNPGAEFRGAPFWAWNGKLNPATCRSQVRQMHEGGLGGFFMHSRTGMNTPYLSKEWFACIDACVDEAKKLGMRAWLYDEDRWPSGAAGGLITKDLKYRARHLFVFECPDGLIPSVYGRKKGAKIDVAFLKEVKAVAVFTAKIDGSKASNVRQVPLGKKPVPSKGESVIYCRIDCDSSSSWYNGGAYLDTLNPDATKKFIQVTHDAYAKNLGKDLGGVVPGIFTDEPNHHTVVTRAEADPDGAVPYYIAWTDRLPAAFRKLAGYDILPRVLELVFDVEGAESRRLRYDFNNCLTELFVKGFVKQIGDWCEKHKCEFTGHMLAEDCLVSQTNTVGSCMRCYEYMQAPGMDMLTENWRIFITAKQVSSAARQFGKKWRLTETYGCTGWDFPFAGHKALGDWQAALGINLRCQHLAWYTMLGQAKRDYPGALFYQAPWWNFYSKIEDYFGRINAVMTNGEEVRDVLLLHPVESAWTLTSPGWEDNPRITALDSFLIDVTDKLLSEHFDFDFGDEDIIARYGSVVSGSGKGKSILKVGKASYKVVVVPSMLTMRSSTLKLLKKFANAGGQVLFAGEIPELVDAVPSDDVAAFAASVMKISLDSLDAVLASCCQRVSVLDVKTQTQFKPAIYLLREDKDYSYFFVCNTGENFSDSKTTSPYHARNSFGAFSRDRIASSGETEIRITCKNSGDVFEFNPETGVISYADALSTETGCAIKTSLPALGSRIFVIPKNASASKRIAADAVRVDRVCARVKSKKAISSSFELRLSEANVLVLDHPEYKIGDEEWQDELEILRLDGMVRKRLGIQLRGGHMFQPWTIPVKKNPKRLPVSLKYRFDVEQIPSGDLFIALESPANFSLKLNGTSIPMPDDCGWWVDTSLRKFRIDPVLLRNGNNLLEAEVDFNENFSGLEIMYLLGNFGVAVKDVTRPVLTSLPAKVKIGDLTDKGLAFYSGNIGYAASFTPVFGKKDKVLVQIPSYRGTAVRVLVDGMPAGIAAWEPNEVDVTDFVESGKKSEIVLELLGSRRNSHGPLHLNQKWPWWYGPGEFVYSPERWQDGYNVVPVGILKTPVVEVLHEES